MKKRKGLFLFPLSWMQKKWLLSVVIAGPLYSAMLVATPFLISLILNSAEKGSVLGFQYNFGILITILLLFCVVVMLLFLFYRRSVNRFVYSIKLAIEERVIAHILSFENSPSKASNIINHDIPNFCNTYFLNIFKIMVSSAFIVAGLILSVTISIYALIIELIFLFIAIAILVLSRRTLARNYDCFRHERQSAIKVISSFINGKLTIQSNNAFAYANTTVGKQIIKKADAEYTHFLYKRISNTLIAATPMAATLFSSLLFIVLINERMINKNEVLAGAFVVGYMIWELFKLVPLLNEIATVKSVREYVSMVGALELPDDDQKIRSDKKEEDIAFTKIELCDVSVRFQDKIILQNISLEFQSPKKYLILGNSGSGKSTLLQALMNSVSYCGVIADDSKSGASYQHYLNYLPQDIEVFPGTVASNIAISDQYAELEIEETLKRANYPNITGQEIIEPSKTTFSGGELRKIAFARALFHEADKHIFLFDEPFEGLDYLSRMSIEKEILAHEGLVVVVSHIADEYFLKRVDQIIILEAGMVVYNGDYENIPHALKRYYLNKI